MLKMKRVQMAVLLLLMMAVTTARAGGDERRTRWGVELGFGGVQMDEPSRGLMVGNEGSLYWATADYRLTDRWALMGGLYYEHNGLFGYYDYDGMGLVTYNQAGLHGGIKYYFLPKKWVVQPYVGLMAVTNGLNLSKQRGSRLARTNVGNFALAQLDYKVHCPVLSVEPMAGVDIHLISSLSLTFNVGYRYGLYGCNEGSLRFINGPLTGTTESFVEKPHRIAYSVGLKMEFPVKDVSERAFNNLLWVVENLLVNLFNSSDN